MTPSVIGALQTRGCIFSERCLTDKVEWSAYPPTHMREFSLNYSRLCVVSSNLEMIGARHQLAPRNEFDLYISFLPGSESKLLAYIIPDLVLQLGGRRSR